MNGERPKETPGSMEVSEKELLRKTFTSFSEALSIYELLERSPILDENHFGTLADDTHPSIWLNNELTALARCIVKDQPLLSSVTARLASSDANNSELMQALFEEIERNCITNDLNAGLTDEQRAQLHSMCLELDRWVQATRSVIEYIRDEMGAQQRRPS